MRVEYGQAPVDTVPCPCSDRRRLEFSCPAGKIGAVYDGHVLLDGIAAPEIDETRRRIRLRYAPEFEVRCQVISD